MQKRSRSTENDRGRRKYYGSTWIRNGGAVQIFSTHCLLLSYWHVAGTLFEHIGFLWPNPSQPEAPTSQVTFPKRKCCDSPSYAAVTNLLETQIPAHRSSAVVATAFPGEYLVRHNSVDSQHLNLHTFFEFSVDPVCNQLQPATGRPLAILEPFPPSPLLEASRPYSVHSFARERASRHHQPCRNRQP